MISNGAYKLQTWNREDRIQLARNPHFHDAGHVAIDQVNYYPSADLNAGLARFRSGEFDLQNDFPTGEIDALRANLGKAIQLDPALLTYYLAVNTTVAKLADHRVRRALSLAIDRDLLTSKVLRAASSRRTALCRRRPPTTSRARWISPPGPRTSVLPRPRAF